MHFLGYVSNVTKDDFEVFLKNGAIITMSDNRTFLCSELTLEENTEEYFLVPEFSLEKIAQKWSFKNHYSLEALSLKAFENLSSNLNSNLDWTPNYENYQKSYLQTQDYIQAKRLTKAVPFVTYSALKPKNFNSVVLPSILKQLIQMKHANEFLYGMWNEDYGFIGSTPEILIQKKPGSSIYNTMALAGTLPINDPINMLNDKKLSEEHQIVIDDISKKLFDQELTWGPKTEKKYALLKHLYSEARFPSNLTLKDLIKRLSPTSALGVFPSEEWMSYEDILKLKERGAYGGPFGLVTSDEIMVLVCLRGVFWDKTHLKICVGGGITSSSIYDNEVKELELKFLSTKTKLGL